MRGKKDSINTKAAPPPLGAYSHAARAGDLLFISGQGARDPSSGSETGVVLDEQGQVTRFDIALQTRTALDNVKAVVESAGGTLRDIVDVTVYLLHMDDFPVFNEIYGQFFGGHRPARTTVGAASLPGKNAIEIKATAVVASATSGATTP